MIKTHINPGKMIAVLFVSTCARVYRWSSDHTCITCTEEGSKAEAKHSRHARSSSVSESLLRWSSEVPSAFYRSVYAARITCLPAVWRGWELIALYIEVYVCGGLRAGCAEEWRLAVHTNKGLQRQLCAHHSLAVGVCWCIGMLIGT